MTTHRQWARLLAGVAEHRTGNPVPDALIRSAVALGLDVSPAAAGCSVTEIDGDPSTPYASNELAMALDQAQYTAGSGPCMLAARQNQPQRVDDMASDPRFLAFAEVATEHGVRSSLSVPLTGTNRHSAVNLYAGERAAFDNGRSRAIAALLAGCLSALLPHGSVAPAANTALDEARADGRLVTEATDRLRQTRSVSRDAAFGEIVRSAATHRVRVAEMATRMLFNGEFS